MENLQIVPLTPREIVAAEGRAKTKYLQQLGKRPDMKSVRQLFPSQHSLHLIHYIALFVALLFFAATSVKVIDHQAEVAQEVAEAVAADETYTVPVEVQVRVMQIAFVFASEFSMLVFLIWFRLSKPPVWKYKSWNQQYLEWLFYVLPLGMSVLSLAYIVHVNFLHGGLWLTNLMPPLVSFTVGLVFEEAFIRSQRKKEELQSVLRPRQNEWDTRVKNWRSDPGYLEQLYIVLQDMLVNVTRSGRKPNEWLKDEDQSVILQAVQQQVRRMTQITRAAASEALILRNSAISGFDAHQDQLVVENAGSPVLVKNSNTPASVQKIMPPNGQKWTPQQLAAAMIQNGDRNLSYIDVRSKYANVYHKQAGHPEFWTEVKNLLVQ